MSDITQVLVRYENRIVGQCSQDELLNLIQIKIDDEIQSIPPIWIDLFFYFLKSEPESFFDLDIQNLVYSELNKLYKSNSQKFVEGVLSGLKYFFQGLRSYLELTDIIREIEPIDYLPEVKTRLYRIPIYSQILESILANLFRFIRDIIGSTKTKDYTNQMNLGNLRDILSPNGFEELFRFVDIDIRNAINHGGVIVSPWDVTFIYTSSKKKDLQEEKTWTIRDPIGESAYSLLGAGKPHFDDYIEGSFDDAGGIIVGFLRFFSKYPEIIQDNFKSIQKDEYLTREYLCRYLSYPGCDCSYIDTGIIAGSSQLNLHFFVLESSHDELEKHSLEAAIIASEWIPYYKKYMIGYRHLRMPPGAIIFNKDELELILQNKVLPKTVMENIKSRGRFMLIFKASDEKIDLEEIKNFRYPIINGENWKIREIEDASNKEHKRFRANLYIQNFNKKEDVIKIVESALSNLKDAKNPPSPEMKIKHGSMPADAIYLKVYSKQSRRKHRIISSKNQNFLCLVESHCERCPQLRNGGIPKHIWDELEKEEYNNMKFAWNPNIR